MRYGLGTGVRRTLSAYSAESPAGTVSHGPVPAVTARPALAARLSPTALIWAITILGGVLRFVRFDVLGFWLDEGFTAMFARMTWAQIFGFEGVYDSFSHPPLYYATTKLFGLVVPEVAAGRLVSVVAGTLTLPVLYALARRITTERIALAAAMILAVSPLHLWYSREARMYTCTMLFVALSYWALAEFYMAPAKKWAALYGVSVLLAMYYDYSAIYALVPQAAVLLVVVARHRREAKWLLAGLALAIAAYLPWIPQWLSAINVLDTSRESYLGVQPDKVAFHLLGVGGVAERGFYLGPMPLLWEDWPFLYWLFALFAVTAGAVGMAVLARRHSFGTIMVLAMLATIPMAILTSLISPGLGTRTIIYALLGWAIVLAAALFVIGLPRWAHRAGIAGVVVVLLFSIASDVAIYTTADKQRWQDLATDVAAVRPLGKPVLLPRPINFAIIDAYRPGSLDGVAITSTQTLTSDAVWFAYHDSPRFTEFHDQLASLGYRRVLHKYYYNPLYLDLYVKPGVDTAPLLEPILNKGP